MPTKYFLYARKSSDDKDKQVRSIGDQFAVMRALAKEQGFHIVREFTESRTAKVPGRPIFNDMMKRIESGEAQGIICWKLDRLARNPIDAASVQWFLQESVITHIRTDERSYYPSDNVMMMGFEFSMANQYVRDLAANTKRGLHEKVKRGEYPSLAPIGYLNDRIKKTIIVDKASAKILKAAFELYAEGNSRLEDIAAFFAKHNLFTDTGKRMARDRITYILSNPFYVGFFRYAGELYEGKHESIVSKKLFDEVQAVLKGKSRPHHKLQNEPKPLCGLLRCGECGAAITGEEKIKHQKNGNVHRYAYYHCTKKKGPCSQPCIREEALAVQLSEAIKPFALPEAWAAGLSKMADADEVEAAQSSAMASQAMKEEITAISQKLQRLLSTYLDEDIERDAYRSEKADLLSRKKSLEEKMANLNRGAIPWLEPMREWIKDASLLEETSINDDLSHKKVSLRKIFGSNLSLINKKIQFVPITPYAALRAARENFAENELCLKLERDTRIELAPPPWQGGVLPLY